MGSNHPNKIRTTSETSPNVIAGRDMDRLLAEAFKILAGNGKKGEIPELWDGKAAERIVKILWKRGEEKTAMILTHSVSVCYQLIQSPN